MSNRQVDYEALRAEATERLDEVNCTSGPCAECDKWFSILALFAERDDLRVKLAKIRHVGHNDDCIFCAFKDRIVMEALG